MPRSTFLEKPPVAVSGFTVDFDAGDDANDFRTGSIATVAKAQEILNQYDFQNGNPIITFQGTSTDISLIGNNITGINLLTINLATTGGYSNTLNLDSFNLPDLRIVGDITAGGRLDTIRTAAIRVDTNLNNITGSNPTLNFGECQVVTITGITVDTVNLTGNLIAANNCRRVNVQITSLLNSISVTNLVSAITITDLILQAPNVAITGKTLDAVFSPFVNIDDFGGWQVTGSVASTFPPYYVYDSAAITNSIPAYDDDAAAGGAGLTTGALYQTTGSGAAPLNAAGIVLIKQ